MSILHIIIKQILLRINYLWYKKIINFRRNNAKSDLLSAIIELHLKELHLKELHHSSNCWSYRIGHIIESNLEFILHKQSLTVFTVFAVLYVDVSFGRLWKRPIKMKNRIRVLMFGKTERLKEYLDDLWIAFQLNSVKVYIILC